MDSQDNNVALGEPRTTSETEKRLLCALKTSGGQDIDTLWSLGVFYSQAEYCDLATACIDRVIGLIDSPEQQAACYLAFGQIQEQQNEFGTAAAQYRSGIALDPRDQRTAYFLRNNLGFCLNEMGENESAVPHLEQALEIDPTRSNAYKNLALSHQGIGNLARAAELFVAATRENAADPRSLRHLESLIEANPGLLDDVPDLRQDLDGCRWAVEEVMRQQPSLRGH